LGFDEKIKLIGMVAYFYPPRPLLGYFRGIKGHEDLIDAFALCLKERSDIKCVIIGGPYGRRAVTYMEKIVAYGKRKCGENIIFMGFRNDVPLILSSLDIALIPSLSENYGGALEALLMEVPTIATSVGGIPEIIQTGHTGFLVKPKSPKDIYEKIIYVLDNEETAKKTAIQGRRLVLNKFNPDETSTLICSIYNKIINN